MAEPFDGFIDGTSPSRIACMFWDREHLWDRMYIDSYFIFIHFDKLNQFLLSKFVCLYSFKLGKDLPSVAPSSARVNLVSQLIKSLGSGQHHGERARRQKAINALGNPLSWLLGATPIQDQKE